MITINFAGKNYRLLARVYAGMIAGCVVLCLVMAGMVWGAVALRADLSVLDRKLKEAAAADEQARPILMERTVVARPRPCQGSWSREDLVDAAPDEPRDGRAAGRGSDARAAQRQGPRPDSTARRSPQSLRSWSWGRKSASFKDPFLKHQSLEKGSISFNVVAVYHENKNSGAAQGGR
jgi:hypothetical protein